MKTSKLLQAFCFLACLTTLPVYAAGGESGGGGDSLEERVNDIRADILKWIKAGGSRSLKLPTDVTHEDYVSLMTDILQPQKVVIGFEEADINVGGVPKTCRGFVSKENSRPHILCNISRFKGTSESGQYRLIHHEYAGLVRLERNDGAASDYEISSQITDYLRVQTVLRLSVLERIEGQQNGFDPVLELEKARSLFHKFSEHVQRNAELNDQLIDLYDEAIADLSGHTFPESNVQNTIRGCASNLEKLKNRETENFSIWNNHIKKVNEEQFATVEKHVLGYIQAQQCRQCDPEVRKETLVKFKKIILENVRELEINEFEKVSHEYNVYTLYNTAICNFRNLLKIHDDKDAARFLNASLESKMYAPALSVKEISEGKYDKALMFIGKNSPVNVYRSGSAVFGPQSGLDGKVVRIRFNYNFDPIGGDFIRNMSQHPKLTNPIKIIQRDLK
ncbi:hypothetical protein ACJVC5_08270 [Peredibacter sp. HCB2-198]|uniref:hypothetical protein n=1 Tax=Peredibacter sp. HCB2-198 TaxID=3383025 RepID=UPI0038B5AFCA